MATINGYAQAQAYIKGIVVTQVPTEVFVVPSNPTAYITGVNVEAFTIPSSPTAQITHLVVEVFFIPYKAGFGQSQAQVVQTSKIFAQVQTYITLAIPRQSSAQAQTYIFTPTHLSYSQAQTHIKNISINIFAQANAYIQLIRQVNAQSNVRIKAIVGAYAQVNVYILAGIPQTPKPAQTQVYITRNITEPTANSGYLSSYSSTTHYRATNGVDDAYIVTYVNNEMGYFGQEKAFGYTCFITCLEFDTSFIGSSSTINSASLALNFYIDHSDTNFILYCALYDYGNSLENADWTSTGEFLGSELASIPSVDFPGTYQWATLTDIDLAANINKTDKTRLILYSDRQAGQTPLGLEYIIINLMNSGAQPKLFVDYTPLTQKVYGQTQAKISHPISTFSQAQVRIKRPITDYVQSLIDDGATHLWLLDEFENDLNAFDTIGTKTGEIITTVPPYTQGVTRYKLGPPAIRDSKSTEFVNLPENPGYLYSVGYVHFEDAVNLPLGNSDRSIEMWMSTNLAANQALFTYGSTNTNEEFGLSIQDISTFLYVGGDSREVAATILPSNFHHLVWAYTGSTKTFDFYLDGNYVDTSYILSDPLNTVNTSFNIARLLGLVGINVFWGNIAYVAIYPSVLTSTQIAEHAFGDGISQHFAQTQAYIKGQPTVFGQAQATIIIIEKRKFAQAQTLIAPKGLVYAQARVRILRVIRKTAQAQVYIIPTLNVNRYAQSQVFIRKLAGYGQSNAYISKRYIKVGLARVLIHTPFGYSQAQVKIRSKGYLVRYNGYLIPGYAQKESLTSIENVLQKYAPYVDGSLSEYNGLENTPISLTMGILGSNYFDNKAEIRKAFTMLRSVKNRFAFLYLLNPDAHYLAITKTILLNKEVGVTEKFITYDIEWEVKPWLIEDRIQIVTISGGISQIVRETSDGGWTPANLRITGTDISISGYSENNYFTGYISTSGYSIMDVNTENYTATIDGVNANRYMKYINYGLWLAPETTYISVTGTNPTIEITWQNRWY